MAAMLHVMDAAEKSLVMTAGAAIFNERGQILLVHQTYGDRRWCTPGGIVDPGEDPLSAALRECREEIGVEPEISALGGLMVSARPQMDFLFVGKLHPGLSPQPADGEVDLIEWHDPVRLPEPGVPVFALLPALAAGELGVVMDLR